jgi:hypothetical protein
VHHLGGRLTGDGQAGPAQACLRGAERAGVLGKRNALAVTTLQSQPKRRDLARAACGLDRGNMSENGSYQTPA